jgi:hypothetical protein
MGTDEKIAGFCMLDCEEVFSGSRPEQKLATGSFVQNMGEEVDYLL